LKKEDIKSEEEMSRSGKATVTNQLIAFWQRLDLKNPKLKASLVEIVTKEAAAEVGIGVLIVTGRTIGLERMAREKGISLNAWVAEPVTKSLWVV
jgi:hypothetical protein